MREAVGNGSWVTSLSNNGRRKRRVAWSARGFGAACVTPWRTMGPADLIDILGERLAAGDVDGALALYEPHATFVAAPGRRLSGADAIRSVLERLAASRPRLESNIEQVLEADNTALVINRWALQGTGPDGEPVSMDGRSADVMRRQPDGEWRILIDDPWGGAA